MKKHTTSINERARSILEISRDEYALCSYIQYRSSDPRGKASGWCTDNKAETAEFVGISRQGLHKMIAKLVEIRLLETSSKGFQRVTGRWIDTESECKQSLHGGVNKVDTKRKQSLHQSVNKVDEVYKELDNKLEKGEREGEQQTPPPPDFDSFMSDVERLAVEAKKEKAPQVAPPPLTIHSGFNEVFDTLYEKDENGEYQIRRDVEPKQPVEFDIEIHEPVKRERVIVPSPKRDGDVAPQRNANQITIKTGMNSAGETYIFEHTERVVIPTPPHITLDMRPNANTPTQLRIAMENFYRDWPLEWSDGILKFSKGSQYTEERQGEIMGVWACHIIKMNQGSNTYQQLNADLQKWFRGQKDFDRNYTQPKNGSKKQGTPNAFGGDQSKYQEVQKF